MSEGFITDKGPKQGCCLSPTVFKIYLKQALKKSKKKKQRNWHDPGKLYTVHV